MGAVSTRWKKLFLRNLAWSADETGISLGEALKAAARTQLETVQQGMVLVGTTANGASASFAIPSSGPGPAGIVELIAELLDIYDRAIAGLTDPTNDELLEVMMMHLVPVRRVMSDFGGVRW